MFEHEGINRRVVWTADRLQAWVVSVHADTPVADLFAHCADSPKALAVVDDTGRLIGVVARVTLLSAMGRVAGVSAVHSPSDPADPELEGAVR